MKVTGSVWYKGEQISHGSLPLNTKGVEAATKNIVLEILDVQIFSF